MESYYPQGFLFLVAVIKLFEVVKIIKAFGSVKADVCAEMRETGEGSRTGGWGGTWTRADIGVNRPIHNWSQGSENVLF